VSEGAVFKQMYYKAMLPLRDYSALICYTDPSYSDTGDCKATVLVGKWNDEYHVIKCFVDQATIAQMIEWHIAIGSVVGESCQFYMEKVFMQESLRIQINEAASERGQRLYVQADTRQKANKYHRIEQLLEPLNRSGRLFLNEAERGDPHMERLEQQFIALSANSRTHDDGPDAVEGAIYLLGQRSNLDSLRSIETGPLLRNQLAETG
jgi:hypothetical protein